MFRAAGLCRRSIVCLGLVLLLGCRPKPTTAPSPATFDPPAAAVTRHNDGVALMGQFDYASAFVVFDELAAKYPQWRDLLIDREIARLNRRQGDDAKTAARQLDELVQRYPDDLRAIYCRAVLHFSEGDSAAAMPSFQAISARDPRDPYATYYHAQCLQDAGRYDDALALFLKSQQLDPYLRSAYYGAFQAYQGLGKVDEAKQQLAEFTRLSDNPQGRLAEIAYTRMGPKSEVRAIASTTVAQLKPPSGPLFEKLQPLAIAGGDPAWRSVSDANKSSASITTCDLDGDGRLDLFVAGGAGSDGSSPNVVLLQRDHGWEKQLDHPLAGVQQVNTALWGDIDNDGRTDVYLCRRGPNQLWRQTDGQQWIDATEASRTSGAPLNSVDGTLFDADHDGDLDIFVVNQDGPNELFNNNLDGTFRPLAAEQGLAGGGNQAQSVVVGDFDSDRDADILVINAQGPHDIYLNDRLWAYRPATGWDAFRSQEIWAAVASDTNVDGQVELHTLGPDGLVVWLPDKAGVWQGKPQGVELARSKLLSYSLAIHDLNGDGHPEWVCQTPDGYRVIDGAEKTAIQVESIATLTPILLANLDAEHGPSLVAQRADGSLGIAAPGSGRYRFAQFVFSGKDDKAQQMRSNASGIGVNVAVRVGDRWSFATTFRHASSPGQSLQPISVGVGNSTNIDFVSLLWPDGLIQSERSLAVAKQHRIEETQRQVSSCPVVFAWNGKQHCFVTDILGVGGIGFNVGQGEYPAPRPWENLLLPAGLLAPNDAGHYELRIGEPMEEAMYLDAMRLVAYDMPESWSLALDERFAVHDPQPTGEPIFHRRTWLPSRVINDRGVDITETVQQSDYVAAPLPEPDRRFVGRTAPHVMTLAFDEPLDRVPGPLWLVFDGWVEYPYSQTMFAAWQAGAAYQAPTIEALGEDGIWQVVLPEFGYMAGMPRRSAVPLSHQQLPVGTRTLRITTNIEIYWDMCMVVQQESCSEVRRREMALISAESARSGFAERRNAEQRRPTYNYDRRQPFWDTRHQAGFYSEFGDVLPLLTDVDDGLAILGPGEEVQLQYRADLPPLPAGWNRRFVLEAHGWCKDMDLYTEHGETLEPLPTRSADGVTRSMASERLMKAQNRRYRHD